MASTPETSKRTLLQSPESVTARLPSSALPKQNNPSAAIGEAGGIETLFAVAHATVVKFTTASSSTRTASGTGLAGAHGHSTLPWASSSERTMAAGPLEIYRVPGSVSFLHSGALLHAILPRSQCWCVDGVSKFAFRVLQDTYYRIDLPGDTPEDLAQVERLKVTFAQVLHYERTPCPFARTFTVDLPEEPPKLRKKRRKSTGPAKRWRLASAYSWKPEGEDSDPQQSSGVSSSEHSDTEDNEDTADDRVELGDGPQHDNTSNVPPISAGTADHVRQLRTPPRPNRLIASRSVTAPPQLTLRSTPPSKVRTPAAFIAASGAQAESSSAAAVPSPLHPSRLRTFQQHSVPVHMPPSPPDSSAGIDHDGSESRIEAFAEQILSDPEVAEAIDAALEEASEHDNSVLIHEDNSASPSELASVDQEPTLAASSTSTTEDPKAVPERVVILPRKSGEKVLEDPYAQIQARILARRSIGGSTTAFQPRPRDSSSSASSTTTLASDRSSVSRRSQSMTAKQQAFASALANKACAVFLGPPAYLVEIMLRIARRIATGALKAAPTFIVRQQQRKVPGSFHVDGSDAEETVVVEEDGDSDLDEDDFGVPLKSPIRLASMVSRSDLRERKGRAVS